MSSYQELTRVKNITLLLIISTILTFTVTVLYMALQDKKENLTQEIQLKKTQLELLFTKQIDELRSKYTSELENFINNNDNMIEAFASKDRERLQQLIDAKFERFMKDEPNFEVICFGLPNMKAFYRAHAPHKFGDSIEKVHGVKEVTQLKKRVSGFIVSKIGVYYRVTFPVYQKSQYIGLISFGINLGYVNDFIQKELNIPSAIVIKTEDLKTTKWYDRLEEGQLGEYTIISSTGDIVERASSKNLEIKDGHEVRFEDSQKIYNIIQNINIVGINHKPIAKVVLFQDITQELDDYTMYLYLFIITLIILIVLLISILVMAFNKFLNTIMLINKDLEELNHNLEIKVDQRTYDLEKTKQEIETIHQHTKASIEYASMIQSSLIPSDELFANHFEEFFTLWDPKDIVGGDIYLLEEIQDGDGVLLMVIDCTGHGVAGALVTMLVKAIERQIISTLEHTNNENVSPAEMLKVFNISMKKLLKQESHKSLSNAGFDGQILYFDKKKKIVKCASARNEIFYLQNGEVHTIKGDRHSVGYRDSKPNYEFTEHTIDVSTPTSLYISSDGYWDQLGGEKQIGFSKKRLKKLIAKIKDEPMAEQKEKLLSSLQEYQGKRERQDDITFIGLKV
ncbi:MAG: SpoIIE family protein phosphatase [Campylobacterota bacterium]|nr:SpoIIE family protein phosphatase [Campylobacterota bacterium]